jgi:hypothetical protein
VVVKFIIPFHLVTSVINETFKKCSIQFYGTACIKNVKNCLNKNIYSYLETSGGQSFNLYLNIVHFFNTSVN